ncbi:MAG TPA: thiamine pyrophosphate-binding protein [Acidimicrobiales bacterium]|nr:thiamine pyrophosphate-binding protein [Acidimicrobiales bacterium]
MRVYEALARAFAREGTSAVFGMLGDANMYWMNALDDLGVEQYEVRHEGAGLAMADGFARLAGEPGVCTTTSGPGCAQLATTMLVASRARTPLVAFCGEVAWGDDEAVQWLDQQRFAEAIEAAFVRVTAADTAYKAVQRAFYLARLESRPVMLSAPMDVQQEIVDDDEEYVPSHALLRTPPAYPNPERLKEAAEIVASSERPVIVVGRGAMRAGAGDAVRRLASRIGALIATTLMAKNWLNDAEFHAGISGLYATRSAIELFQEADCVIGVGASLNRYTTEHGLLYPNARVVHLDSRPNVVMGDGRLADCFVHTDARLGVEALDRLLEERSVTAVGYHTPEVKEKLASAFDDPARFDLEPGTVDPREACRVIDSIVPPEIGLVLGGGQQICFSTMLFNRGRSWLLANQHFGCIGQGLTTAIGALVAKGKRPAFLVEGDAGFLMHLAEFETAVRYRLPLLVVVMNDEALGAEYQKSVAKGLKAELARIPTPDLGAVARAMGGAGALARTIDEVRDATAAFVAQPRPTIIDVRISRQVISIPYRRLWFGQDA